MERLLDEVYLKEYKDFVRINDLYYGGSQMWLYLEKLRSKFWANRSCGVVAAGNTLVHMAMYKMGFEKLYEYPSISKREYINFVNEIYDYLKPTVFGVYNLHKMDKGIKKFAKKKSIILESRSIVGYKDIVDVVNFIKSGLESNCPVMMLTWNNKNKELKYHWTTITGYIKDSKGSYIIISNWGEEKRVSLDEWVNKRSLYKGLIYFTLLNEIR